MFYGALLLVRVVTSLGTTGPAVEHHAGSMSIAIVLASVAFLSWRARAGEALGVAFAVAFAMVRAIEGMRALAALGGEPMDAASRLLAGVYGVHACIGAAALAIAMVRRAPSAFGLARFHWTALAVVGLLLTIGGVW
jgi:hypothetical protein